MTERYDLIIVGMGSGGLVAAEFAAGLGLRVAVAERDRVGGDCLWTGCVPSKALLASARAAHTIRTAERYGLSPAEPGIDTARVWDRIHAKQAAIATTDDDPQRFVDLGVDIHYGAARLTGPHSVRVGADITLEARFILLCTGSRPRVPPVDGLVDSGFLTSETFFARDRAPDSVVMIGGGPISIELAQGLRRLGVPATVLQSGARILPNDDPELVATLTAILRSEGVIVELGVELEQVGVDGSLKVLAGRVDGEPRTWRAAEVFVAAGRCANVEGLGLEQAGVVLGPRGVEVDPRMRTNLRSVYAVGDVVGRFQFTHSAAYEASSAVRNMFFPGSSAAPRLIPWCTFTDPELAHAGETESEARAAHGEGHVEVFSQQLIHSDRARCDDASEGTVKIVTARGRIVGAHALAPAAGELIHELSLAIKKRLRLTDLASLVHIYPTLSLATGQLAGEAAHNSARRYRWLVRSVAR